IMLKKAGAEPIQVASYRTGSSYGTHSLTLHESLHRHGYYGRMSLHAKDEFKQFLDYVLKDTMVAVTDHFSMGARKSTDIAKGLQVSSDEIIKDNICHKAFTDAVHEIRREFP